MEKLNELEILAEAVVNNTRCRSYPIEQFLDAATPENILAIAEAFRALEQRAEAAEAKVQCLNATAHPVSDGWVTVPVEPTEEMLAVGSATDGGLYCIWKDMLAAAPGGQDDYVVENFKFADGRTVEMPTWRKRIDTSVGYQPEDRSGQPLPSLNKIKAP